MRYKEYKNGGSIDPNYYTRLSEIESNNNPQARSKTSSASGRFQFIKSTWEGLTKKYNLPYSLEDRFDSEKSKKVAELYTQENANYLKNNLGITPNNTDLYAAHFMGVGGASKLLSTLRNNPNASAYEVATSAQINANKPIFLRKDGTVKTAKEVYDTLKYKVTRSSAPTQNIQEETQKNNPYRFSEYKKTDYYAPQVSENISSLDNTQETANLAEDKATEIKNRLEQKKAEKALLQQMILATQVAYVNPADYQSQPTFEEPLEYKNGGEKNSLWKNIRANRGSGRKPTKEMLEQGRKIKQKEDGGVIEDDRGQWAHPGEVTKINSGTITMEGIGYPVYGVDNLGNSQMMYPGQNYQFPGTSVTEYPQTTARIKTKRFSK